MTGRGGVRSVGGDDCRVERRYGRKPRGPNEVEVVLKRVSEKWATGLEGQRLCAGTSTLTHYDQQSGGGGP
jgi:hypothetical protein